MSFNIDRWYHKLYSSCYVQFQSSGVGGPDITPYQSKQIYMIAEKSKKELFQFSFMYSFY